MLDTSLYTRLGLGSVYDKVVRNERLSTEDGLALFACPDPHAVGALAHHARLARLGRTMFWVRNRHINYTNVCVNQCLFCAYSRTAEGEDGAFVLSIDQVLAKIAAAEPETLREVHIVGGCHPTLRLDFFIELLSTVKRSWPHICLKAFTAVEIAHFAKLEGISIAETLAALKSAGLDMLPGGGAEIFDPAAREQLCPEKLDGRGWLEVTRTAHDMGIRSNATMLFGHVESHAQRIAHMAALRELQDETGGFLCFIPLPFQTENSKLALPENRGGTGRALDVLKTIAVSRLFLDNFRHIKAYWIMLGLKQAVLALSYGADDLDGTVVEERIGHMAGAKSDQALTRTELEGAGARAGFIPVERDALFRPAHPDAPKSPPKTADAALALSRAPFARDPELDDAARTALAGERLDFPAALALYERAGLHFLGELADAVRAKRHPDGLVTYVVDRNINYTDVCSCGCSFCAYFKKPGDPAGFVIGDDSLFQKIEETVALGGNQILLQGGHHPELPLDFYVRMLSGIKSRFPTLHIHGFSPPEIVHLAGLVGLSTRELISRLIEAGLGSIPGGGAEILVDRVRQKASPNKCLSADWLRVMEEAHELGLRTTATMMFGHLETPAERLEHLFALRELQDRTRGFTAFIPWAFQPGRTGLEPLVDGAETAQTYLRVLAISRLVLDNVDNVQASWVTMGPEIAEVALHFGANDLGSTMIEENVVKAAGVGFRLAEADLCAIARAAGFTPSRRSMDYRLLGNG